MFETIFENFQAGGGDNYSNLFLSQIFGPLFINPVTGVAGTDSIFSVIVTYFNFAILAVMTIMLLYNAAVGAVQSAHEGKLLGQRWSSLWAPLRVLFAYTLVIPIPSLGYNVAQVFVAWIVKGATWFASWVWSTAIVGFLSGVVPISPPIQQVTPEVVRTIWENASCMVIKNAGFVAAGIDTPTHITLLPPTATGRVNSETGSIVGYTHISQSQGQNRYYNECGSFSTPEVPVYIQQRQGGVSIASDDATAESLEEMFSTGHNQIAVNLVSDISTLANNYAVALADPRQPLPVDAVANGLRVAMNRANTAIETLNQNIMNRAIGVDDNAGNAAREAMRDRITGGSGCTYAGQAAGEGANSESCYGEGWIGAGAWYMTIARLNSEMSSLMVSSISAERQEGIRVGERDDVLSTQRVISSGGSLSDREADSLRNQESFRMARHMETFANAANRLSTYGFALSSNDMVAISRFAEAPDSGGWFSWLSKVADAMKRASLSILTSVTPDIYGDDPMVSITDLGQTLIDTVVIIMGIDALVERIDIWTVTLPLLAAGVFMSYVLPMMPFIFWILGVTGYFLVIVEAVIAVNLWALSHAKLDGEGLSGEAGRAGWIMLLALMVTPALMIFGYLAGMILFRVTVTMIHMGIGPLTASLMSGSVISTVFGMVAVMVMLCFFYIFAIERSFSLVASLAGKVLRWMNGGIEVMDGGDVGRGRAIAGAGGATINSMANKGHGVLSNMAGRARPRALTATG